MNILTGIMRFCLKYPHRTLSRNLFSVYRKPTSIKQLIFVSPVSAHHKQVHCVCSHSLSLSFLLQSAAPLKYLELLNPFIFHPLATYGPGRLCPITYSGKSF